MGMGYSSVGNERPGKTFTKEVPIPLAPSPLTWTTDTAYRPSFAFNMEVLFFSDFFILAENFMMAL